MCEICIGIIYSKMLLTTLIATMKEVEAKLLKSKFQATVMYVVPPEMEELTVESVKLGIPPGLKQMVTAGWDTRQGRDSMNINKIYVQGGRLCF